VPNEWEGYGCLERSVLFDSVRVTFAYEWKTEEQKHNKTEELKFHSMN
jgi:hypothetical protein